MEKWYSYIVKENAYGVLTQGFALLAGIISVVVFPNIMGKGEFGYFSLAVSVSMAWLVFADAGLNQVALKFLPRGKDGGSRRHYDYLFKLKLALAVAASVALFLLSDFIAVGVLGMQELGTGVKLASVLVFLMAFTTYFERVLFALKGTRDVLVSNFVFQICRLGVPVLLFYAFMGQWIWVLVGTVMAYGIYGLFLYSFVIRRIPGERKGDVIREGPLRHYMLYSLLGYAGVTLVVNLDPIVIGLSQGAEQVAAYRVAWLWVTSATTVMATSQSILFSAHARESMKRSRAIVTRALKYAFAGSFLAICGIILLSGKMLTFFYSGKYSDSYAVMAVLSLIVLEAALNAVSMPVLLGKGRVRMQTLLSLLTGVLQLCAMLVATPVYGILGTAVCVVCVRVFFALITAVYAVWVTGARASPLRYVVPVLSAAAVVYVLEPYVRLVHDIPGVVVAGVAVAVAYSLLIVVTRTVTIKEIADLAKSVG